MLGYRFELGDYQCEDMVLVLGVGAALGRNAGGVLGVERDLAVEVWWCVFNQVIGRQASLERYCVLAT